MRTAVDVGSVQADVESAGSAPRALLRLGQVGDGQPLHADELEQVVPLLLLDAPEQELLRRRAPRQF